MTADQQLPVVSRARNRAVDVGELPAILLVPGPDFGRHVGGGIAHENGLRRGRSCAVLASDRDRIGKGAGLQGWTNALRVSVMAARLSAPSFRAARRASPESIVRQARGAK